VYRTNTPAVALPTTPGAIIGYRRDGRPIRLIGGGAPDDGDNDDAGEGNDTGGSGDGNDANEGDDNSTDGGNADDKTGDGGKTFDAAYVKRLRDEAAANRTEKQQLKATLDAIAKALTPDGDKPDPAKLASQLEAEQTEKREALVENAVIKAALKAGADVTALTDSRSFMNTVNQLDPAASDFGDKVADAIKTAIKNNPKLKAGQVPGRSGGDHSGGPGGKPSKPKSLAEAVNARIGGTG
jgi:hypothetical protein